MSIARDISRQTSRQTATLTANQTSVTVTGGFSGSSIDVYLNGSRIVQGQDYSLNGTSGITLSQGASAGDIIEFVIRNTSNSGFSAADTGQIVDGAVTYNKLSNSATEADNVQKRTAKAWVNFNGTDTVAIRAAYNVSSITDNGTGHYTVNFTEAMPDNKYATLCTSLAASTIARNFSTGIGLEETYLSGSVQIFCETSDGAPIDHSTFCVAVFR